MIVGDDDSSTIANLRVQVDENIEKLLDVAHAKQTLDNHLYAVLRRNTMS